MRLRSPQHIIDSDQRTVRLALHSPPGRLTVVAPPHGAVAPPGYYYLFVNLTTRRGPIPSMARVVRIGPESDLSEAPQPFPDLGRSDEPMGEANEDDDSSPTAPLDEQTGELLGVQVAQRPAPKAAPVEGDLLMAGDMPRRRAWL